MTSKPRKVVVVDDDPRNRRLERMILEQAGFQVVEASSGEEALQLFNEELPHLVLLDVNMRGMDGFSTCKKIRELSNVPIIIVTGTANHDDQKIRGFELGADDYVTKPFSPPELLARAKAVLRRAAPPDVPLGQPTVTVNDLVVDLAAQRVSVSQREVALTGTEFHLLAYLAVNAGRVMTPNQILERVWGGEYVGDTALVRVTIGRLRQKLGDDPHSPRYIQTRHGIGYGLLRS